MKESGACAYVVTAHKSTAVTHSCVGNFTSATDVNLIIGKTNRIGKQLFIKLKKNMKIIFERSTNRPISGSSQSASFNCMGRLK